MRLYIDHILQGDKCIYIYLKYSLNSILYNIYIYICILPYIPTVEYPETVYAKEWIPSILSSCRNSLGQNGGTDAIRINNIFPPFWFLSCCVPLGLYLHAFIRKAKILANVYIQKKPDVYQMSETGTHMSWKLGSMGTAPE